MHNTVHYTPGAKPTYSDLLILHVQKTERTSDSSGFSTVGHLISASAVFLRGLYATTIGDVHRN